MLPVYAVVLTILNAVFLWLVALGLPGTWLMVLATGIVAWIARDAGMFSPWTIVAAAVLAAIGEGLEFVAGVAGAKKAGASRAGALGALAGGLVGAFAGQALIPVPVVGAIVGASAGAFLGAAGAEKWRGEPTERVIAVGKGAAVGRFLGTLAKLAVGVAIFLLVTVAAFWP
jgi:hypothetical protein